MINPGRAAIAIVLFLSIASLACAKRSRSPGPVAENSSVRNQLSTPSIQRININTASTRELESLPGIGEGMAQRIVEHRDKYGPFRRPEHLMMVRGISDKRFRALRERITVE